MDNPYLNTYGSGCQYQPYLSWETSQDVPQPQQAKESNLENTMVELENSMAEMRNLQDQMDTSCLEEAMVEMAMSQIEFSNSQAQFMNETRTILQIQSKQLKGLEMQVGQMAKILFEE